MTYLQEFKKQITKRDIAKFLVLWEEYCANDRVDADEFLDVLDLVYRSDFQEAFGKHVDKALPLWHLVEDEEKSYRVLQRLVDLQTKNDPLFAEEANNALEKRYGEHPQFMQYLRLIGLRGQENFQGALSHFSLLLHMKKGNFVFHQGGWGTGEIMDISPLREHLLIEFENVSGAKDFSFANAFRTLVPLAVDHFLARRFGDPDSLEEEAKRDPVGIIRLLLEGMGPKTAVEIKDAMCELVIPEKEWSKWWQGVRSRLKRDPLIEMPPSLNEPFILRRAGMTEEEGIERQMKGKESLDEKVGAIYTILRDQPHALKNNAELRESLAQELIAGFPQASLSQALEISLLLENFFARKEEGISLEALLKQGEGLPQALHDIDILALRKRVLAAVQTHRADWPQIYLAHFLHTRQGFIKDFLFHEFIQSEERELIEKEIDDLVQNPNRNPDTVVWYFQKIADKKGSTLPYSHPEGRCRFFEAFLVLYSRIESMKEHRGLLKKMYNMMTAKRYELVRTLLKEGDISFAKEFLLLVAKCQSLSRHDVKILYSLAEVAHPSLKRAKETHTFLKAHENCLWTTEEGYLRTQKHIQHLGTVEVVENAKEIEAARALGDLRENAEYKFALEHRARLQSELRRLSQMLNRARVLTKRDVTTDIVDVGAVVELVSLQGNHARYTILGPWDADVDKNIVSFQSKLAEAMIGCKKGEKFPFKEEEYEIVEISSFFDQ